MRIENLHQDEASQVHDLLERFKKVNPQLTWQTYPMDDKPTEDENKDKIEELEKKIDSLITKIDLIFGNYILLPHDVTNVGVFRLINPTPEQG